MSIEENKNACRELTDAIYDGLDVQREIYAVAAQKLGDRGISISLLYNIYKAEERRNDKTGRSLL